MDSNSEKAQVLTILLDAAVAQVVNKCKGQILQVLRPPNHRPVACRAALVDKDKAPRWTPAALGDVIDADVDAMFAPLPDGQALRSDYYL